MKRKKTTVKPPTAPPDGASAAAEQPGASRLTKKTLIWLCAISAVLIGFSPAARAQNSSQSFFEQIPSSGIRNSAPANATIGEIEAIGNRLDEQVGQITAAINNLGSAISEAGAKFSPGVSNEVEQLEMEAFRVTSEALRFAVENGPKALSIHQRIAAKADRVSAMLGTRIATRREAARRLAEARQIPAEFVDVELTPGELRELRDYSIMSDEVKFTAQGTRLHLDRLDQIIGGVARDRAQLAVDGARLAENISRMEMLQRVVRRFAEDALAEHKHQAAAEEVSREARHFGKMVRAYDSLRSKSEQVLESRGPERRSQDLTLETLKPER